VNQYYRTVDAKQILTTVQIYVCAVYIIYWPNFVNRKRGK